MDNLIRGLSESQLRATVSEFTMGLEYTFVWDKLRLNVFSFTVYTWEISVDA